ncbi:Rhamnose-binding lectin [Holothuria leucospilota]|uniref:Rhamnose-binding lectin n=1 Tax=Holothuria leucospilota TaxID=206669 RepID=A0A9Q1BIV3_HOLLE|nr:Rhamnose-binding lectin [Holothuria leucospilota]
MSRLAMASKSALALVTLCCVTACFGSMPSGNGKVKTPTKMGYDRKNYHGIKYNGGIPIYADQGSFVPNVYRSQGYPPYGLHFLEPSHDQSPADLHEQLQIPSHHQYPIYEEAPKYEGPIDPSYFTQHTCLDSYLRLDCQEGYIRVVTATFGRVRMDICSFDMEAELALPHLCKADISTFEVARQCQGKHSCSVHASVEVFRGDPCPDIPNKYLEVVYECREHEEKCAFDVPEYETVTFCEDELGKVECPEGYLIRPLEGSYGRQGSDKCNGKETNGMTPLFTEEEMDCKNPKAFTQVCELCKGKQFCTIPVTQKKFDREKMCPGVPKPYLSFQYYCIKDKTPDVEDKFDGVPDLPEIEEEEEITEAATTPVTTRASETASTPVTTSAGGKCYCILHYCILHNLCDMR